MIDTLLRAHAALAPEPRPRVSRTDTRATATSGRHRTGAEYQPGGYWLAWHSDGRDLIRIAAGDTAARALADLLTPEAAAAARLVEGDDGGE